MTIVEAVREGEIREAADEAIARADRHGHRRRSPAQPRFCTPRNPKRESLGQELIDIIRLLGYEPLPWQEFVAMVALELDEDGDLVYREVVMVLPRRSGKTVLLLALRIWRALKAAKRWRGAQHTAYVIGTAKYPFAIDLFKEEELPVIKASPFGRHVKPTLTLNKEGLRWRNRSRHSILAATKNAGHSMGLDQVEIDEAFKVPDGRLEDGFGPAMLTRRSPQMWIVSAIGDLSDEGQPSAWLWSKVEAGRARCEVIDEAITEGREPPSFPSAYFEWSAREDADPADPETWWSCMPALGFTQTEKAVRAEFELRSLKTFSRAYLCIWPGARRHVPLIDPAVWASPRHRETEPRAPHAQFDGPLFLGIAASPGCQMGSLVIAGHRTDGAPQVEVLKHADGVTWLADDVATVVKEIRRTVVPSDGDEEPTVKTERRPTTVLMASKSPAAVVLPELEALHVKVQMVSMEDVFRAAEAFMQAFTDGNGRHIGQAELDAAIDVAIKRTYGERFAFARADAGGDISTLEAGSIALWRALHPEKGRSRFTWL